jgi:hypothetical protein
MSDLLSTTLIDMSWCPSSSPTLTINTPTIPIVYHDISDAGGTNYIFNAFTIVEICDDESWVYKAKYTNGVSVPSYITVTSSTRTFSVTTTSAANIGIYDIRLYGILPNGQKSFTDFKLYITNCVSATFNLPVPTISDIIFTVTQSAYT